MLDHMEELYQCMNSNLEFPPEWMQRMEEYDVRYRRLDATMTSEQEDLYEALCLAQYEVDHIERRLLFLQGLALGIDLGRL